MSGVVQAELDAPDPREEAGYRQFGAHDEQVTWTV
jgi:hypothetical protein